MGESGSVIFHDAPSTAVMRPLSPPRYASEPVRFDATVPRFAFSRLATTVRFKHPIKGTIDRSNALEHVSVLWLSRTLKDRTHDYERERERAQDTSLSTIFSNATRILNRHTLAGAPRARSAPGSPRSSPPRAFRCGAATPASAKRASTWPSPGSKSSPCTCGACPRKDAHSRRAARATLRSEKVGSEKKKVPRGFARAREAVLLPLLSLRESVPTRDGRKLGAREPFF